MKVRIVNVVLLSALFVQLFTGKSNFSVLGISIKDLREIREILLVASISLDLLSGFMQLSVVELRVVQKVLLETFYENKAERDLKAAVLPHFYGAPILYTKQRIDGPAPTLFAAFGHLVLILSVLVGIVTLVAALLIPAVIQIAAWWQIFRTPALSEPWNTAVLVGTAAGIFGSIAFATFRYVRLPFRDFSLVNELAELRKTDKTAYEKRIEEIESEQSKR